MKLDKQRDEFVEKRSSWNKTQMVAIFVARDLSGIKFKELGVFSEASQGINGQL